VAVLTYRLGYRFRRQYIDQNLQLPELRRSVRLRSVHRTKRVAVLRPKAGADPREYNTMDRLPQELLQRKRTVAEMNVGESACVLIGALSVDREGGCWIRLKAQIFFPPPPVRLYGMRCEIQRQEDGYHIRVPRKEYSVDRPIPGHEVRAVSVTLVDESD
jgi:hypothetical protein